MSQEHGELFGQPTSPESFGIPMNLLEAPKQYDKELPHLARTVAFIDQFRRATRPKAQENLLAQMAAPIMTDLASLGAILSNFDLIRQLRPSQDLDEAQAQFWQNTERFVTRRAHLASWTPEKIDQLIQLGLDSSGAEKLAYQRLQVALFNAPRIVEDAVDLHYNAAWAMVDTDQNDVRAEIYSILSLEKPWLQATSRSVMAFEAGMFAADDLHLARYHSFRDALYKVGVYLEMPKTYRPGSGKVGEYFYPPEPKGVASRTKKIETSMKAYTDDHEAFVLSILDRQRDKNPLRFDKLMNFDVDNNKKLEKEISNYAEQNDIPNWLALYRYQDEIRRRPWPENIVGNPDEPLRRLVWEYFDKIIFKAFWEQKRIDLAKKGFERLTDSTIDIGDYFFIDVMAKGYDSPERRSFIIRQLYARALKKESDESLPIEKRGIRRKRENLPDDAVKAINFFDGIIMTAGHNDEIVFAVMTSMTEEESGGLSSILEYHRPSISLEKLSEITKKLTQLRQDIKTNFNRAIGKRGYRLVISDPILRNFGYKLITFKQAPYDKLTNVDLEIAGQDYKFILDEDYRIIVGEGDIKKFANMQDQSWLELLVLSHLKKLVCTDESQVVSELVGREKQLPVYRRQIVDRIEHIRRMPPGWRYSTDAYLSCLRSGLPVKRLDKINELKAEIGKGGTIETGLWTYVSPSEKEDTEEQMPIKVAFANAAEDLRKVIPLGEVSDEELARMEEDLLDEVTA